MTGKIVLALGRNTLATILTALAMQGARMEDLRKSAAARADTEKAQHFRDRRDSYGEARSELLAIVGGDFLKKMGLE